MPRLVFLKDNEIELFDFPPGFTEEERNRLFVLPDDNEIKFRKTESKIGYILQEGYFMFCKKFFLPEHYHIEDVEYVKNMLGIKRKIDIHEYYNKITYSIHRKIILNKYGYLSFSSNKILFEKEAFELVKTSLRPKEIFDALLDYLAEKRIEVPRYYFFAEVISKSLNLFENNLIGILDQTLTADQKEMLDHFMDLPVDSHSPPSAKNPYLITYLKNAEQSVAPGMIKQSLEDFHQVKNLHDQLSDFFKTDLISNELINYYAIWVLKAEHIQFDSIGDTGRKRLYATSFITFQYKIRQDYFVDTFLQAVQKYYNDADNNAIQTFLEKDMKYKKQEQVAKIRKIISDSKEKLKEIREIVFSQTGGDSEKMRLIREILNKAGANPGDAILEELEQLENNGIKSLKNRLFYEELDKGCRKLLNRVSGILQILEFNPQNSNPEIYKAIEHYQKKSAKINNSDIPLEFLGNNEQKWLFDNNGALNYNLYKVFLFKAVFDHIKSGTLNLLFSERYKSVDDYLLNPKRWDENKKELILRAGLEQLDKEPHEIIKRLKDIVDNQYKITNENITDNPYIRFNTKGIARVKTPKNSSSQEEIIPELIGKEKCIPLTEILSNIRYCIDYISSFTHYSVKGSKSTPSDEAFYAAIIALGCNIGIRRMGKISEGMTADRLEYIVRWFCSKKNIDQANKKIISLTNSLPLSVIYLENREKLNTSSDGQKYDVTTPSLHASHSSKYFGTGKGVSVYSFIDEKDRLFYNTVISASERESGYLLDGLFHNESTTSDTHSTDTHGYYQK